MQWTSSLTATPTIVALRNRAEEIRRAELEKTLQKITPLEEDKIRSIEQLTAAIVNKLIHPPMAALKSEDENREQMLDLVQKLFNLEFKSDNHDKR